MKIIRTNCELQMPLVDQTLRDAGHELVLLPDDVSEDELVDQCRDAGLLLMCYTAITGRVLAEAKQLQGIVKYGVGIDAIDIEAAKRHGVPVVNIPEYAEETVAEGAFALTIALAKKLQPLGRAMNQDGWVWPEAGWMGHDLAGKTFGLVGVGKIGRSMARMAGAGFRAKVLGYSPSLTEEEACALGMERCDDLHAMLSRSDFVSVHCVLNDSTRGLIGKAEFEVMKDGAFLTNVSRGAIVDEEAMLQALKSGKLGGAALDVFSQEPLRKEGHFLSELFEMPNVILSPHLTFYTREAMERLEKETLERCFELIEGRDVVVKSKDPRLTSQTRGVRFEHP
ncbi:2-hydroxyacid dehydrogenase [Kiloniella sp. b19]|uniref:2-hydroxyacid dehydrogenase n=1 Tax=Kiloniella sp. GXU_MW_B19 TaxID=3141326 RepID=UPI0031D3759F